MSCLVIVSAMVFSHGTVRAASKPSLSRKTVTLKKGKTVTLKIRHASRRVRWSTTNKKIASVKKKSGKRKQKAVIKAGKKSGTCYIKAKIGKRTLKCKIKVKKTKKTTTTVATKPETTTTERKIETKELSGSTRDLTAGLTANPPKASVPDEQFILGFTEFSLGLLRKSVTADRETGEMGNILISPDSVATALAMTENGAGGTTLKEMEDTLAFGISGDDYNNYLAGINRRLMASDASIYTVSNSIWARDGMVDVRQDFLQKNKDYHDAQFFLAPFDDQTVKDMNNWVYNKSRNMIDKIIDTLSKDARMVLINTVAFEGQWAKPFNCSAREEDKEDFKAWDGTKQKVTMLKDCDDYQYLELAGGKGFVKYYGKDFKNSQIAFVGLLPPEGMDADEYLQSMDASSFMESWKNKKSKRINVTLPRFSYDYGTDMGDILQEMGMQTAFTDDADFSKMADPTPETPALKISKVLHKTHIELDEKGTKAAAATAVVMEKATAIFGDEPLQLRFDRPFVYALVDNRDRYSALYRRSQDGLGEIKLPGPDSKDEY